MSKELPDLARLGEAMEARRGQLRLSVSAAARRAGLARDTWEKVEAGKQKPYKTTQSGIEEPLRWAPGSVAALMEGGDAIPIDGQGHLDRYQGLAAVIEADPGFEEHEKTVLLAMLRARLERPERPRRG